MAAEMRVCAQHNRKFLQICDGPYPRIFHNIGGGGDEGQRFDLRFLRRFRADLSIRKSSSFFPPLIAATSQRGLAPRPAQVSPDGPRYFGGTFLPFKDAQKAFRQPAFAGPRVLQRSSLIDLPLP